MTRPTPIECGSFNVLVAARHGYLLVNRHDIYIGRSIRELGEFSEAKWTSFDSCFAPVRWWSTGRRQHWLPLGTNCQTDRPNWASLGL